MSNDFFTQDQLKQAISSLENPFRLAIVDILSSVTRPLLATELHELLVKNYQRSISLRGLLGHLESLEKVQLVNINTLGRRRYYRLPGSFFISIGLSPSGRYYRIHFRPVTSTIENAVMKEKQKLSLVLAQIKQLDHELNLLESKRQELLRERQKNRYYLRRILDSVREKEIWAHQKSLVDKTLDFLVFSGRVTFPVRIETLADYLEVTPKKAREIAGLLSKERIIEFKDKERKDNIVLLK